MQKKERVIDLRQYFQSLWEHALIILIVCCVFAAGMSAYSYKKQKNQTSEDKATIDAIVTQNREAYYSLSSSGSNVYTDADAPAGTYTFYARLYVEFNHEETEAVNGTDYDKVSSNLQKDACMLIWDTQYLNEIIDELDLKDQEDLSGITAEKLSWMINRNFQGAHVMNIAVTDVDPERAQDICEAVVEKYIPVLKKYMNVDEVRVVNEASLPEGSKAAAAAETHISKGKLVKYGVVGFAGGFGFMAILLLLAFIIIDCVRNESDLDYTGFHKFGKTITKKNASDARGLAYKLAAEEGLQKLLLLDVDGKVKSEELCDELNQIFAEKKLDLKAETADNLKESSEALYLMKNYDALLLTASYGKTRISDLEDAYSQLENAAVKKLGVALVK